MKLNYEIIHNICYGNYVYMTINMLVTYYPYLINGLCVPCIFISAIKVIYELNGVKFYNFKCSVDKIKLISFILGQERLMNNFMNGSSISSNFIKNEDGYWHQRVEHISNISWY